ncbi:hypothetical protein EBU94_05715 [bacterium]|nr:hypothetical protein [bacterium]
MFTGFFDGLTRIPRLGIELFTLQFFSKIYGKPSPVTPRMKVLRKDYPRVRETMKSGRKYYEVDCRKSGWVGKPRITFSSRDDALNKAKEIGKLFQTEGVDGLNGKTKSLDTKRFDVLENQLSVHGKTLEDAVAHYLEYLQQTPPTTATIDRLTERWFKCVSNDKNKNNRQRTIIDLRSFSKQFGIDFKDILITEATRNLVSEKINKLRKKDGKEISQQTRKNYLSKAKQFFNWCVSEELISSNPISLEKVRVDQRIPKAYSVEESTKILRHLKNEEYKCLIPYICLGLFAGLRPTEAERIRWDNIHFDNEIISIEPNQTKVKRSRHAELNHTLKFWLKDCDRNLNIKPSNFLRIFKSFKSTLEVKWIPDGLRHTYATYWLPIHEKKDLLANYMGNSRSVIDKHYLKPALKSDAVKYWDLKPF